MKARTLFVLFALGSSAGTAGDEFVHRADANGDGFVSLHELRAAHYADPEFNKRIEQTFLSYDRDGDGLISAAERQRGDAQTGRHDVRRATGTHSAPQAIGSSAAGTLPARPAATARVPERGGSVKEETESHTVQEAEPLVLTRSAKRRDDPAPGNSSRNEAARAAPQSTLRKEESDSRYATWLREIDADNSGGASRNELLASSGGKPWFIDADFIAADRNRDEELNDTELASFIQSLERRQR